MQVQVNPLTDMTESNIKIEVHEDSGYGKTIKLNELPCLMLSERVVCEVKVTDMEEEVKVNVMNELKRVQDVIVTDATGSARLTLWEDHVGRMEVGGCYILKGVKVKEYQNVRYLVTAKNDCKIEAAMEDTVVVKRGNKSVARLNYDDVRVAGVKFSDNCKCIQCENEVVLDVSCPGIGTCGKCGITQYMDIAAQVIVRCDSKQFTLQASGKIVEEISEECGADLTPISLLKARPFSMEAENGKIVTVLRK